MTQQFKFGDRVRHPKYGEGIFLSSRKKTAFVVTKFQSLANHEIYLADIEELELIPHPDTVRLNFIQNSSTEIQFYRSNDDDDDDYDTEWFSLSTPRWDLRETIDNAMQQEQTK